jgi:hypothetical protein
MPEPAVRVRIGELVLVGFGDVDRSTVAAAASAELDRLLTSRREAWPSSRDDTPARSVTTKGLEPGMPATALGTSIGRAVYQGLGQ